MLVLEVSFHHKSKIRQNFVDSDASHVLLSVLVWCVSITPHDELRFSFKSSEFNKYTPKQIVFDDERRLVIIAVRSHRRLDHQRATTDEILNSPTNKQKTGTVDTKQE